MTWWTGDLKKLEMVNSLLSSPSTQTLQNWTSYRLPRRLHVLYNAQSCSRAYRDWYTPHSTAPSVIDFGEKAGLIVSGPRKWKVYLFFRISPYFSSHLISYPFSLSHIFLSSSISNWSFRSGSLFALSRCFSSGLEWALFYSRVPLTVYIYICGFCGSFLPGCFEDMARRFVVEGFFLCCFLCLFLCLDSPRCWLLVDSVVCWIRYLLCTPTRGV